MIGIIPLIVIGYVYSMPADCRVFPAAHPLPTPDPRHLHPLRVQDRGHPEVRRPSHLLGFIGGGEGCGRDHGDGPTR